MSTIPSYHVIKQEMQDATIKAMREVAEKYGLTFDNDALRRQCSFDQDQAWKDVVMFGYGLFPDFGDDGDGEEIASASTTVSIRRDDNVVYLRAA